MHAFISCWKYNLDPCASITCGPNELCKVGVNDSTSCECGPGYKMNENKNKCEKRCSRENLCSASQECKGGVCVDKPGKSENIVKKFWSHFIIQNYPKNTQDLPKNSSKIPNIIPKSPKLPKMPKQLP